MSIKINDVQVAGNFRTPQSDWNATTGQSAILNKPTNLVHTTGNESIAGNKTFSGSTHFSGPATTTVTLDTSTPAASATYFNDIVFASNGVRSTTIRGNTTYDANTQKSRVQILLGVNGINNQAPAGIKVYSEGGVSDTDVYATAPQPKTNTTSSDEIDTVGARNTAIGVVNTTISGIQSSISDIETIRSGAALGATALQPNSSITGATKCKITYDSKGLVTAGANLSASDIPNLASNKITAMTSYTKPSSTSAIATSDSLNAAIGKLEAALDTKQATGDYALDNAVVHKTGNETVAGQKTFTSIPYVMTGTTDCRTRYKLSTYVQGTAPSSNTYGGIRIFDNNNIEMGTVFTCLLTDGSSRTGIWVKSAVAESTSTAQIYIGFDSSGNAYTYCPTPSSATDNSTKIATTAWVKSHNAVDTALVHTTGNETIAGTKTFSSTIQGTAYRALYADLAEYYDMDMNYPTGTLVQFGGEREMTIASTEVNAVISENPALVMNSKEDKCSQPIALIGKVKIRIEGKVNKFDKIVLSENPGIGITCNDGSKKVFARALENKDTEEEGLVLCSVKINLE